MPGQKKIHMTKVLQFLVVMILVSGCQSVLKTAYGIKAPKIEDRASVKGYLVRHDVDTSNVYIFKSLPAFAIASQRDILSIPDALFFNREGDLVPYKDPGSDCNAKVGDFIHDLSGFDSVKPDKTQNINELLELLENKENHDTARADVNVFITWTVYAGKLNRKKAFEWVKVLQHAQKRGANLKYFLVNCDYQQSWNIPADVQKKLGIKHSK
jgi:uncharacterized protein YceK